MRVGAGSTWVLGSIVFALTWGGGVVAPTPFSLDVSSHTGFQMATVAGLDFGEEIAFSYGPLGFVKTYLVLFEWPARLAALYGVLLHLAVCLTLVFAARRSYPAAVAFVLALFVAALVRGDLSQVAVRSDASVVALTFIWCVVALTGEPGAWVRRLVVFGGGAFAALELLAKLNTGALVLLLVAATVAVMPGPRVRNLAQLAGTFAGTAAVLWLATGHGIGDVGSFVSANLEIASGYSTGARLEYGTRDYDYVVGPLVVALVFGLAWLSMRGLDPLRRATVFAMLAAVAFATYKNGYVSHEEFHMATFYGTFAALSLAFVASGPAVMRAGAAAATVAVCVATATTSFEGYPLTDPVANVRNGISSVTTYLVPGRLEEEIDDNQAALVDAYGLEPATLGLLEGRTVHADPGETAAIWAHGLEWQPLPVFQSYVASWTPELDRRNADALAANDAPERILRQAVNPLNRVPGFESPAAAVEMLCRYESLGTQEGWQVLGRIPHRCGTPRPGGALTAAFGEPIKIPPAPPGMALVGRVEGFRTEGADRLRGLAHRGPLFEVSLDGAPPQVFMGGAASNGLLLRAPDAADYPEPYTLAPNADTITFLRDGGTNGGEIEIELFALPIRTPGR